jgi:hypothetical protein
MVDHDEELTTALEAALVRELKAAWQQINSSHFKSALSPPTLVLVESRSTLGRWVPVIRTIEISRAMVVGAAWGVVIEVLKHEAAHQYVHEILGEKDQTAHGLAFRSTCARFGIDAGASGVPEVGPGEPTHTNRIVERITRLLALAESPNRNEAQAAMAAAQRLMLKYNLDAARAQTALAYAHAHLGRPTGRVLEHERLVAMILGRHFFVEVIWVPAYRPLEGKRGSVLEICGTAQNLAIAEYVHGFLHETAERLWREHRQARNVASNRERRAYLAGVMTGFSDTLARQAERSRGEGLVWVGDGDLDRYFRRRHPHIRHVRHAGQSRSAAWSQGREAGRQIVLHRPFQEPSTSRGRLLPTKT